MFLNKEQLGQSVPNQEPSKRHFIDAPQRTEPRDPPRITDGLLTHDLAAPIKALRMKELSAHFDAKSASGCASP
jgi:hypothetical protein